MQRIKWIIYFCEKYITKVFLICAFLFGSFTLFLFIFALAFKKADDPLIWFFLPVGLVAFIAFSSFVIVFVFRIIREERRTNCVFLPSNVEKVKGLLYFSDEWIIICGKTAIHISNLTKIATGSCSGPKGGVFFCVAFYIKNREKPIQYKIGIGYNKDNEPYEKLRDLLGNAVKRFDCPYEENQVF